MGNSIKWESKLFVEINNSENLNEFIKMINEALEYNEPLEIINNIIADSLLDKIINENYINQFISENQGTIVGVGHIQFQHLFI